MRKKIEVGYVCRRGHFVFKDDPEGDFCGTKNIGTIYVKPIRGADMEMFREAVEDSLVSQNRTLQEWRKG